ncbi:uncharacterized protein [Porites lutea]|uniref:uncharacterized protein n=1 Tax=Porites lutea TaxID=51062 RepID=UPI003CC511A1
MSTKLWLIALISLAVSFCYEASSKEDTATGVATSDEEELGKADSEDDSDKDLEEDDESDMDQEEENEEDFDSEDYEDPSPWLWGRRTRSKPSSQRRRTSSGSWWRRRRTPAPVPRPRPRPRPNPPQPRPAPTQRPARRCSWWRRCRPRPAPPVPRPRPRPRPNPPQPRPAPTQGPARRCSWWRRCRPRPAPPAPRPRPQPRPRPAPIPVPRPRPITSRPRPPNPLPSRSCILKTFNGVHFTTPNNPRFDQTIRVEEGFYNLIRRIDQYAGECSVTVFVTSSFRTKVVQAKNSNHLVGHAIDMNLQDRNGYCSSSCLLNPNKSLAGVTCFISRIRADPRLRWGGDFKKVDPVHIDDNLYYRDVNEWNRLRRCFIASDRG